MPMAMPAAEATTPAGLMPAAASPVPTAEAATMPASETGPPAGFVPVPAPGWSPGKPPGRPTVEAGRRPDEPRPATAERSDHCSRPERRDASGDVAAAPPAGSDGREGQDRRTDKEREGRRREDDERWRRRHNDGRRRQDHNRGRQRGAEQRADRRR